MNHKLLQFSIGVAFVILVWQAVIFFGDFNEALFPGPITVFGALVELIKDGTLFVHIKDSMRRFAIGYVLAGALAIVLGLLLGRSRCIWPTSTGRATAKADFAGGMVAVYRAHF